jgi:hypothetical protein
MQGRFGAGRPDNGIYRGRLCFSYQPGDGIASALGNQAAAFQCGMTISTNPSSASAAPSCGSRFYRYY